MKRIFTLMLSLVLVASLFVGCTKQPTEQTTSPVAGKKIAYVLNMPHSDIFTLCANQSKETAEKLGMTCDIFCSEGDDETFKNYVYNCAKDGYDGLYLSHGGADYSYTLLTDLLQKYADLKIVTYDTEFLDENGQAQTIDGVTQLFQDDAGLATSLLEYICTELCPDKKPVKVLKVWVGPGYISAFDRREVGYKQFVDEGKIQTVDVIGPTDHQNATESVAQEMKKALETYGKENIDAVWVAYDAYARGAYQALKEAELDIPLVSVDLCNADIAYMLEENSNWYASACTDFKANGEQGVRILALELNGQYDAITAPGSNEPTAFIEVPASLITKDILKPDTTVENIYDVAPETYGNQAHFVSADWLKALIGY